MTKKGKSFVVKSEAERLVYAEVYSPLMLDTDGESMTAPEIKKMAHKFLANGRTAKIDVEHDRQESGCTVVESFLARADDPDGFVEDSWVLGVHVEPDDLWADVLRGEINGFSFSGAVNQSSHKLNIVTSRRIKGVSETSLAGVLPPHSHKFDIQFSKEGKLLPCLTSKVLGHRHDILKTTATAVELDHGHRLILIENGEN